MIAVCEVNIGKTRRAEHHRISRRLSPVRVRRGIVLVKIGFHFDNPTGSQRTVGCVAQDFSQKLRRDNQGGSRVEWPRQNSTVTTHLSHQIKTAPNWKVNAAIVLVSVTFGGGFIVMKILLREFDPRAIALFRAFSGAIFFLPWLMRQRPKQSLKKNDWIRIVLAALTGIAANQLLFVLGLSYTTAGHSSVINSAIPVLTIAFAFLAGSEFLTGGRILGFLVSLGGILYLLGADKLSWNPETLPGDLITLGNASSYSLYLVIARPLSGRFHPGWITGCLMILGTIFLAPFGLEPLLSGSMWKALSTNGWYCLGYVVLVMTIGTYGLIAWILAHAESSRVAQGIYLQPFIAITLGAIFLGESISPRLILAAAMVLGGVALSKRTTDTRRNPRRTMLAVRKR